MTRSCLELDADGAGRAALRIEAASVDTGIAPVALTIRACLKRAA